MPCLITVDQTSGRSPLTKQMADSAQDRGFPFGYRLEGKMLRVTSQKGVRTVEALARNDLATDPAGSVLSSGNSGVLGLIDGTVITYRPIRPQDATALQRFHRRLSDHAVRLRFFSAKPELSDKKAGYFTHVDGVNRFALVALDPGCAQEIIAVASFDREGETDRAEYAAAVEDRWQGKGLGLALTQALIRAALQRNVRTFTGLVLPENTRMLNLLRDLNLPERLRYEDGVEFVEISLLPEHPNPGQQTE